MQNGVCALKCCNRVVSRYNSIYGTIRELCDFHQNLDPNMHRLDAQNGWLCLRIGAYQKETLCSKCGCPYYYFSASRVRKTLGPEHCPNPNCGGIRGKNNNYHPIRKTDGTILMDAGDGTKEEVADVAERKTKPIIRESNPDYSKHVGSFGLDSHFYINYPFKVRIMEDESYSRKGIKVRTSEEANYKPHANLAFDRVVAEVLNLNAAFSKFGDDLLMVDVGGSPQRRYIHSQKFSKIVYLVPTLDCADVVRSLNRLGKDDCLDCTLGSFMTQQPHFINMTQSLYYIGLEGLFEYMYKNRNCQAAFASVHSFDGDEGEIFNEAIYRKQGEEVQMHVLKTNKIYEHWSPDVLFKKNGAHFERDGQVYTLAWDYHDHTLASHCFTFVLRMGKYAISDLNSMVMPNKRSVVVRSHHGFPLLSTYTSTKAYPYISTVDDEVVIKAKYIDRNAANFATVVRAVLRERRELVKIYSEKAIIANVGAAFYGTVKFESDVLFTNYFAQKGNLGTHARMLQDKIPFIHDFKFSYEVFAHPFSVTMMTMIKMYLVYLFLTTPTASLHDLVFILLKFPRKFYHLLDLAFNALIHWLEGVRVPDYGHSPLEPPIRVEQLKLVENPVGEYYFWTFAMWILSFLPIILAYYFWEEKEYYYRKIIDGMKIKWFRNDYENIDATHEPTMSSDTPLKYSLRAFVEQEDHGRKREKSKPLYPLLGNINGYTPNNTDGTVEFTETSINLRWIEPGPSQALNNNRWRAMHRFYEDMLDSWKMPEALNEITPEMFTKWISRFTGLKLKMLIKGVEHLGIVNNDVLSFAGWSAFIKREKLYKTLDGEIKPRGIVHANPVYNAFFGPWFYHMYAKLKEMIKINDLPITIASGINRTQLSETFNEVFVKKGFKYIYENDFTQFEKTHTLGAYILESQIYKKLGMPSYLVDNYVKLHGRTKAKTSKYSAFEVDFARFSGDQTTSIGNSSVNAFTTMFVLIDKYGLSLEDFHLLVLGDDILIFCRKKINIEQLSFDLSEFGFKSKLREADVMDATFLSMNFLLCEDGKYRAYPRIGKFLLSRSHCTSVKGRDDPKGVLKSNFLSEEKYVRTHPVLGPFCKSVLMSLKSYKVRKDIEQEVRELAKYKLAGDSDFGYESNVDRQFFNDYMMHNYGLSVEQVKEMVFKMAFLGYKHEGIEDTFLNVILQKEEL